MGIFPDAQGQLTPQSLVESGWNSNSSEILWLSSLPARTKKIRSKMKELECSQHYTLIFQTLKITLESVVVSSRNWNSSKLSCMSSLPTRMKVIHTKMNELECSQYFSHYRSMGIFPDTQGQLTPQCRLWYMVEIRTHPSFHVCPSNLQE